MGTDHAVGHDTVDTDGEKVGVRGIARRRDVHVVKLVPRPAHWGRCIDVVHSHDPGRDRKGIEIAIVQRSIQGDFVGEVETERRPPTVSQIGRMLGEVHCDVGERSRGDRVRVVRRAVVSTEIVAVRVFGNRRARATQIRRFLEALQTLRWSLRNVYHRGAESTQRAQRGEKKILLAFSVFSVSRW